MQSISSVDSSKLSCSNTYKQVNEIKSAINFKHKPIGLKRFRISLVIVFFLITVSSISLLAINNDSKKSFLNSIDLIRTEKQMKVNISYSRLCLIMLFLFGNTAPEFWNTFTINIPLQN